MATHRWLGTTSTDISEASNWSSGTLPALDDTIIFNNEASNRCTGMLITKMSLIVVQPDFVYGLGPIQVTESDTPLIFNTDELDIRNVGINNITPTITPCLVTVYGAGHHTITGGILSTLTLAGSLNNLANPAFIGQITVDADTDIQEEVITLGSSAGRLTVEGNDSNDPITTLDIDGRGMDVILKRVASNITLEGAPTGFTNTLEISPESLLPTTYAQVNIQGNTITDSKISVKGAATITSLKMDNGLLTFSDNIADGGASISAGVLYGAATIDLRNTLQNITLTNIRVFSQDASINVDNGASMSVTY